MIPEKVTNATPDGKVFFIIRVGLNKIKWIHKDEQEDVIPQWQHSVKTGEDFDIELRILNSFREYR